MNAAMWIVAVLLVPVVVSLLSGLLVKEAEGWIERAPRVLLRLARRRLPADLRDELYDEWSAELYAAVHAAEARPISRLVLGLRFAAGLLRSARSVAKELGGARVADEEAGRSVSTHAGFATAIAASGRRVKMLFQDLPADQVGWLFPADADALALGHVFMVDEEGQFLGVASPERRPDGSLKPVIRDGEIYVMARVDFSDPGDPARRPLAEFIQRIRRENDAGLGTAGALGASPGSSS